RDERPARNARFDRFRGRRGAGGRAARDAEGKARPAARARSDFHPMVEKPGEALDDRQSQPQALAPVVLRIGELIELAEDVFALFHWNAGAAVDHIDANGCAATTASYEYAASRRVANGVRNEIL